MDKFRHDDEIDLTRVVINVVQKIKDNFVVVLLCFIIGIGIGIAHYNLAARKYSSTMVVSSEILTKSFSQKVFDNIQNYVKQGNYKAVSHLLNVPEETAATLASLKVDNASEIVDGKDHDRFVINVDVFDPNALPKLQDGIVYYLANNDFVKSRVEQNRTYLTGVIEKADQEIKDLEDFKDQLYKGDFWKKVDGNIMFDPTSVNSKIVELTKEKLQLVRELGLVNSVQVIEGFNIFDRPSYPKLSLSVGFGLFLGGVLTASFIAIKAIGKLMQMKERPS